MEERYLLSVDTDQLIWMDNIQEVLLDACISPEFLIQIVAASYVTDEDSHFNRAINLVADECEWYGWEDHRGRLSLSASNVNEFTKSPNVREGIHGEYVSCFPSETTANELKKIIHYLVDNIQETIARTGIKLEPEFIDEVEFDETGLSITCQYHVNY